MKKSSLLLLLPLMVGVACTPQDPSARAATPGRQTPGMSSEIKLVADSEPGETMVISGTIYLPDGKTPAKNAILSLWQTDAKGYYIAGGGGAGELHPRIHGRLRTGADGKYTLRTIRPGQYPSHTTPAHVHAHLSAPGFPEYAIIFYFEGDDLITEKNRGELNSRRGGTPSIIPLIKDSSGVLTGRRDLVLEYVKPSGETLQLQW